ncbi:unnamed protein product [Calypogeia fissa]
MLIDMDLGTTTIVPPRGYYLTFITGTLVAAVVLYQVFRQLHSKWNGGQPSSRVSWPPSPPALPILGHLHLIGANVHRDMHALSVKYGPLVHLQMGSTHSLVVSSAEMAKLVLKTHDKSFASRPSSGAVLEIFSHNYQDLACAPYGPHWRHMRKICVLELLTCKRIQSFSYLRNEEMSSLVRSIWHESTSGQPVTISVKLAHLLLNIMALMTMGKRLISWGAEQQEDEAELKNFKETITEMFILSGVVNNLGDYFPSIRWMDVQGYERRMRKTSKNFDDFVMKLIKDKRALNAVVSDDKKDMLDVLLSLTSEANGKLSDETVMSTMQNILSAGVDTSSSTVEWALTEMSRKPFIMEKVRAEIDSVVGKARKVDESDLPRLPYLGCVVKEALRLHPAAPLLLPHESIEPVKLLNYDIPAKTRLYVNAWAIGRDPSHWTNPLEFYPERFLDSDVDVTGQNFGLLPFGSGRRMCPGMVLGLTVIQFTLARLLHSFEFSLPSPLKPEDVDMGETFGLTIFKTQPLQLMATPRLARELYD